MSRKSSVFLAVVVALLFLSPPLLAAVTAQDEGELVFDKAKMFVSEQYKMKLKDVKLVFTKEHISIIGEDKAAKRTVIPYAKVKEAVYEYSQERRWGAAVLVSGLFLLSKGKKHWFTLVQGADKPEETVFQLHKDNYAKVLEAFEKASGQKVRMQAGKQ